MKKKEMTIEDLAVMTQKEFKSVNDHIDNDANGLRSEMNARFDVVDKRLDYIQNLLIRAHDNRIQKIEDDIRVLKTALKTK